MKRVIILIVLVYQSAFVQAQEPTYDRIFFENSPMAESFFYSEAKYSAPSWIKNASGRLPVTDTIFFTPGNSLLLHYVSKPGGSWSSKILYKSIRGQDFFAPATHLVFRIFVTSATTAEQLPTIALVQDSVTKKSVAIRDYVTNLKQRAWIKVSVPLTELDIDESNIDKLQAVEFRQHANDGGEHIVYLDQLELSQDSYPSGKSRPELSSAKGFARHVDITWRPVTDTSIKYIKVYRSGSDGKFKPVGIQSPYISRFADYTGEEGKRFEYKITLLDRNYKESAFSNTVSASTKPMTDEQLLDMVQEAHFRYYWEGAEKNSGLALENIHGRRQMIATGASGFGIMALLVGAERKFITRKELVQRFDKITSFLQRADKFHGAFPHFLNGRTGKTEPFFGLRDNGADLVETSFLAQGLLAARQYFNPAVAAEKTIIDRIDTLWRNIEWDWFRKEPGNKFLIWHWSPDQGWVMDHKLIGWNETLITYFMAISSPTHSVPGSFFYSGWASQSAEAQEYRQGWGQTKEGFMYTNGNTYFGIPLKVGVSNGGPLFFIHYSFLGLDPRKFTDKYTNYYENNRNIALINYRYCVENPENHQGYGADAWGLTASDGLWFYQADEPVPRMDHGKITPTGALASFPYTPEQSMAALKNYYYNYGKFAWGEYGFYDAFNLDENWRSEIFMGLNQGPIAVMIENYRSGLIWKLFMKNPEVQEGLKRVKGEK